MGVDEVELLEPVNNVELAEDDPLEVDEEFEEFVIEELLPLEVVLTVDDTAEAELLLPVTIQALAEVDPAGDELLAGQGVGVVDPVGQ